MMNCRYVDTACAAAQQYLLKLALTWRLSDAHDVTVTLQARCERAVGKLAAHTGVFTHCIRMQLVSAARNTKTQPTHSIAAHANGVAYAM